MMHQTSRSSNDQVWIIGQMFLADLHQKDGHRAFLEWGEWELVLSWGGIDSTVVQDALCFLYGYFLRKGNGTAFTVWETWNMSYLSLWPFFCLVWLLEYFREFRDVYWCPKWISKCGLASTKPFSCLSLSRVIILPIQTMHYSSWNPSKSPYMFASTLNFPPPQNKWMTFI